METFNLTAKVVKLLAEKNSFNIPSGDLVFFGLRGAFPFDLDKCQEFKNNHKMILFSEEEMEDRRFKKMSCTLGQWDTKKKKIAIFPGSTLPYIADLKKVSDKRRNILMTGFFEYKHQSHNNRYPAFGLKNGNQPISRSYKSSKFKGYNHSLKGVEHDDPGDNIHASSCDADTKTNAGNSQYFSDGCQVIAGWGYSSSWKKKFGEKEQDKKKYGPFHVFQQNAKNATQKSFWYMLLNGSDAKVAAKLKDNMPKALRFGSLDNKNDNLVSKLQAFLNRKKTKPKLKVDGDFGGGTLKAIIKYQIKEKSPSLNGIAELEERNNKVFFHFEKKVMIQDVKKNDQPATNKAVTEAISAAQKASAKALAAAQKAAAAAEAAIAAQKAAAEAAAAAQKAAEAVKKEAAGKPEFSRTRNNKTKTTTKNTPKKRTGNSKFSRTRDNKRL